MSILMPIQTEGAFPLSVLFTGETSLQAEAKVLIGGRVTFVGATELVVAGKIVGGNEVVFVGATALEVFGRLNNEANVFGEVLFAGATALVVAGTVSRSSVILFEGATSIVVDGTLLDKTEFGFTFFVTLQDTDVSNALSANHRRYAVRLLVDSVELPILSADLVAAADKLGTELAVTLATTDADAVTYDSTIDFDLGIYSAGAFVWIPILQDGKLSSRSVRYANDNGRPADQVSLTFVDVIGDRWNRAPDRNVIIYDSASVPAPSDDSASGLTVYNSNGAAIPPQYIGRAGLRLRDVLESAFVDGSGFDSVVTNLQNIPVDQVVFSMSGGYDAGVRPLLSLFEPIMFVVNNDLWIVSLDYPLPAGLEPRVFSASSIESLDDVLPGREPVSGLLVTVKADGGDILESVIETTPSESGEFGTEGFTTTTVERHINRWKDAANPTVVLREDVTFEKTTVEDWQFNVISRETRTDHYDALSRPTGYTRSVEQLLPDLSSPTGELLLQTVSEEEQRIDYTPYPLDPNRDIQSRVETHTRGLILQDPDNQYLEKDYRIPLGDAHKSGYISPGSEQTTIFGPIKSEIITLQVKGGQVRRERRLINHITNSPDALKVETLPGDATIDRRRQSGRTRTVLLTVEGAGTQNRRVQTFDGTGLPQTVAIDLAKKKLAKLNRPPAELSVDMPYIDPTIRKGSDLNIHGRSGLLGQFVVAGYSARFVRNGDLVLATMRLETKEVK